MRVVRFLLACAALVLLSCAALDVALAEDPIAADEGEDRFAHARSDAEKIEVRVLADKTKELPLEPGPLYISEEPPRQWVNGTCWVWGERGRPAVFLTMTTLGETRYYEFLSLTTQRLEVDNGYGGQWTPEPGWTPLPIDDAPAPAADRRRRMAQMRSLARRFTAHSINQFESGTRYELKLLPQPIYRYAEASEDSLDGGIFGLCLDNNAEVILILDAAIEGGEARWVFDCERMSVCELVVELDGGPIWRAEPIPFSAATPQSTYHIFSRQARPEEMLEE
jgi:hypothetical protein